jgi:hypothetical protein
LTRGSVGSIRAGRITERETQVAHGLADADDCRRIEEVVDRDLDLTIADGEISLRVKCSIRASTGGSESNVSLGLGTRSKTNERPNEQCESADPG